jgi:hypothetical protein
MVSTTALSIGTIDPEAGLCDTTDHHAPDPPFCSVYSLAFSPAAVIAEAAAGWLDMLARPDIPTTLGTMEVLPNIEGAFSDGVGFVGTIERSGAVVAAQPSAVGGPIPSPVLNSPARPSPKTTRVTATTASHRKRHIIAIVDQVDAKVIRCF